MMNWPPADQRHVQRVGVEADAGAIGDHRVHRVRRPAFGSEMVALGPNEMRRVDFRLATFRWVEFRGLDMHDVLWPVGDDHLLVEDYRGALAHVLSRLAERTDSTSQQLSAVLEIDAKWAGPHQRVGVLSRSDLRSCGEGADREILRLLEEYRARSGAADPGP